MTPESLVAHLNGVIAALPPNTQPTEEQWRTICANLQSVFTKMTPDRFVGGQGGAGPWPYSTDHSC